MKAFDLKSAHGIFIEIGQSTLKLLEGEGGMEWELERQSNGRLSVACRERLKGELSRYFGERGGWGRTRRVVCALNARGVSMRQLTVPEAGSEELDRVVAFQVEREFPLGPAELAWGYVAKRGLGLGSGAAESGQRVLVAAVRREILEEYLELLGGTGVEVVFTLGVLVRQALCAQAVGSYAQLDIGREQSELVCFESGWPVRHWVVPWGGADVTKAIASRLGIGMAQAETLKINLDQAVGGDDDLGQRIRESIEGELERLGDVLRPHAIAGKVFLSGRTCRLKEIAPGLARAFGDGVICERLDMHLGPGRSAATLGLKRLSKEGERLPIELRVARVERGVREAGPGIWRWLAIAAGLLVAAGVLRYSDGFIGARPLSRKLSEVKSQLSKLPAIDRELEFLQYYDQNQEPYLEVLELLASAAPRGTRFDAVTMTRRGEVSIRGMTGQQQPAQFRKALVDSGFFSAVVIDEQTPTQDRQRLTFRISAQWKTGGGRPVVPVLPASPASALPGGMPSGGADFMPPMGGPMFGPMGGAMPIPMPGPMPMPTPGGGPVGVGGPMPGGAPVAVGAGQVPSGPGRLPPGVNPPVQPMPTQP